MATATNFTGATITTCCSRCGKELTDPASRECGVGPVCRRKSNDIFARELPADVLGARRVLREIQRKRPHVFSTSMPCQGRLDDALDAIEDASATDRKDWREVVESFEFVRSFPLGVHLREAVDEIVSALGYPLLVGIWNGSVAKGKARVLVTRDGRFGLQGVRPPASGRDILKAVPGARFSHDVDGEGNAGWHWPAEQAEAAGRAACKVYLVLDPGQVAAVVAQCGERVGRLEAAGATFEGGVLRIGAETTVSLNRRDGAWGAEIRSPYSAGFVSKLKSAIHWKGRQWVGYNRCWLVTAGEVRRGQTARGVYAENLRVALGVVFAYYGEGVDEATQARLTEEVVAAATGR